MKKKVSSSWNPILHSGHTGSCDLNHSNEIFPAWSTLTDNGRRTLEATILYAPQEPLSQGSYLCRKIGQGQPWVIIYINFVVLEYQMSYTKFQANQSAGSGEEDLFKDFTI